MQKSSESCDRAGASPFTMSSLSKDGMSSSRFHGRERRIPAFSSPPAIKQRFQIESWVDQSESAIEWFDEQRAISKTAPPSTLSLRAIMGPDFPVMARNLEINLLEGRVGIVQVVMKHP
jgi:hypothetical protein